MKINKISSTLPSKRILRKESVPSSRQFSRTRLRPSSPSSSYLRFKLRRSRHFEFVVRMRMRQVALSTYSPLLGIWVAPNGKTVLSPEIVCALCLNP